MSSSKQIKYELTIKDSASGELKKVSIQARSAEDAMQKLGNQTSKAMKQMQKSIKAIDFSSLTLAATQAISTIKSGFDSLIAPVRSFETAMASVNTMAGKSADGLRDLTGQIKDLSGAIPLAREELANGLYQVISNGVPEDSWIGYLEQSAKAAVGGMADLGQTVTVTSTLIKNYGADWADAGHIQDMIQTTAKNGVTSFEQLGAALPRVSTNAAQLGVSMEELMAVFATTTGVTGNTAEVSTQLAAVLNSLVKPSSEASKAAAAMGIQFNAAAIKSAGGFDKFLRQLDAAVQDYAARTGELSQTIYGKLFGSAEALRLLGSLTGEQRQKFTENIAAMAESTGTINQAFQQMASTGEATAQMAQNQRQSWTDWIGEMASAHAEAITLTAALGTTVTAAIQTGMAIKAAVTAMQAYGLASKVVTGLSRAFAAVQATLNIVLSANPIGIIVMTLAGLATLLRLAYMYSEDFRRGFDKAWVAIKNFGAAVWDITKTCLKYLLERLMRVVKVLKAVWDFALKFWGLSGGKIDSTAKQTASEISSIGDAAADASDEVNKLFGLTDQAPLTPETPKIKTPKAADTRTAGQKRGADLNVDAWALTSIEQYDARLQALRKAQETANARQYAELQEQINKVESLRDAFTRLHEPIRQTATLTEQIGKALGVKPIEIPIELSENAAKNATRILGQKPVTVPAKLKLENPKLPNTREAAKDIDTLGEVGKGWGALKSGVNAITSMTDAIREGASAWDIFRTAIDGTLSILQAAPAVMSAINMLTGAATAAKTADTVATTENTTANVANAASGTLAAHSKIPFVGIAIAGGAIAVMLALMASLPKFAEGGLAYGPTIGMFGEYPGASNNPEVVAPLSRLRGMIQDAAGSGAPGMVEFRIKGRDLEGVLNRRTNFKTRL